MRNAFVLASVIVIGGSLAAQGVKPVPASPPKPAAAPTPPAPHAAPPRRATPTTPVIRIETAKGRIVIETYPADAPRSFEHVLKLVKRRFYDGQAVHRAVAGQLVQFGDPQTRNMMLVDSWGRGPASGSGAPIGVVEISKTRRHQRGTVALAHSGSPAYADSQLFIVLRPVAAWDGNYTIIGQVTSGIEVVDRLVRGDKITTVTVTGAP